MSSPVNAREMAATFRAHAEEYERRATAIFSDITRQQMLKTAATYRSLADRIERDPPKWMDGAK
jgi:hypothetical protein